VSRSLLKSTGLVGFLTLLSRLLGFARDLLIAQIFGATGSTDAFFVAFKIPNFLRRLFAEGAFSQAFIPVLASAQSHGGKTQMRVVIDRVSGTFAVGLLLLTIAGVLASPLLITIFAPGFSATPQKAHLAADLLRITFPYLLFIALTALAGSILNTLGHFLTPALTPIFLNIAMIAASLFLTPYVEEPITALAIGVLIGGVLQLSLQIVPLWQRGYLPHPKIALQHPEVRRVMGLMSPALFGASITQINLLINTFLASLLTTGSISWLYYADRLLEFPLGLLGVALGTVILPQLARSRSEGKPEAFSETLDWALRTLLLIGLPATLGLVCLAEPLMFTLFQHDQFHAEDARMAARSLVAYGAGLPAFLALKVLVPAFSAEEDLRTPARIGIYAVGVNLLVSLVSTFLLAPPGWGHAGLALAASTAASFNAMVLWLILKSRGHLLTSRGNRRFVAQLVLANAILATVLIMAQADLHFESLATSTRIKTLAALILGGAFVYLATLLIAGVRPRHLLEPGPH
jgi:putative peptidoglycan lipid II flippase